MTPILDVDWRARQRDDALRLANQRRLAAKEAIAQVRAMPTREGALEVARMIETLDPRVAHVPVGRLLIAPKQFGDSRRRKIARHAGLLTVDKPARDLTARQRASLALALMASTGGPR